MRSTPFKIVFYILLAYSATVASALDTAEEEKACKDIGFTKKNADFGQLARKNNSPAPAAPAEVKHG